MVRIFFAGLCALTILPLPAYADDNIQVKVSAKVAKNGIELAVYGKISGVPAGTRVRIQLKRYIQETAPVGFLPTLSVLTLQEKSGFKLEQILDRGTFLPGRYGLTISVDPIRHEEEAARKEAPPPQEPLERSLDLWIGNISERLDMFTDHKQRLWQDMQEIEKLVEEYDKLGEPHPKQAGLYGMVYRKQQEIDARRERMIFPWTYEMLDVLLRSLPVQGQGKTSEKFGNMSGGVPPKDSQDELALGDRRELLSEAKGTVTREFIAALVEELTHIVDDAGQAAEAAQDKQISEAIHLKFATDLTSIESTDQQARKENFGEVYTSILKDDKGNDRLSALIKLVHEILDTVQDAERKEKIARFQKACTELPDIKNRKSEPSPK